MTRLQHSEKKLISVKLLYGLLVLTLVKSQVEDVFGHDVNDDALVIANLVF